MSLDATVARVGELAGLLTFASPQAAAPAAVARAAPATPFATQLAASMAGPVATSASAQGASTAGSAAWMSSPAIAAPVASIASTTPFAAAPSPTLGSSAAGPATPYAAEITAAAARNGIDPNLLAGLIRAESNFDPGATSPAGAQGLTQLMPATAAGLGVTNPLDPVQSIEGGARYLRQQLDRFGGDAVKALAAYNAGPGAVERFGGVPPYAETQGYVRRVLAYAQGALA